MSDTIVHLGLDDIDSPSGGCTTHFASILVERLTKLNAQWFDYPNLIRLNPNIPYRTRGNGSVALRFRVDSKSISDIIPLISGLIGEYIEKAYPNTNPGVVLVRDDIPGPVITLSENALWRVVPVEYTKRLLDLLNIENLQLGSGRGIVGALAAVGTTLPRDHTYEYIAYRSLKDTSQPRRVKPDSVLEIDKEYRGRLFSSFDYDTRRIMIEPHGPDPVLFGVRGEDPEAVIHAGDRVRSEQKVDRWLVFRSNQGTGQHLSHLMRIRNLRPYMAARVKGAVSKTPRFLSGGHVLFEIDDGDRIACAVYEPTGDFRKQMMQLVVGDQICVHAGVRPASRTHRLTLNVEGLDVLTLEKAVQVNNPICSVCSHRMKSAGKEKGFKCPKCGHRDREAVKIETPLERDLQVGVYVPPVKAQRHLTRPLERMHRKNIGVPQVLVNEWHKP